MAVSSPFRRIGPFPSLRIIPGPSLPSVSDGAHTSKGRGPGRLLERTWFPDDQEAVRCLGGGESSFVTNRTDFADYGNKTNCKSHEKYRDLSIYIHKHTYTYIWPHFPVCCFLINLPTNMPMQYIYIYICKSKINFNDTDFTRMALPSLHWSCACQALLELTEGQWCPCPSWIQQKRALLDQSSNPAVC